MLSINAIYKGYLRMSSINVIYKCYLQMLFINVIYKCYLQMFQHVQSFKKQSTSRQGLQFNPFPRYTRFLKPLQQTTFENIVANGELAKDEQFLLFHNIYQLYSLVVH